MAGSLLGPDQVLKLSAMYPSLVNHIRALLLADNSAQGLMRVHVMVESFDSDEMARIFRELSFISPFEKKALVRAAIYELMASEPALFIAPKLKVTTRPFTPAETAALDAAPKTFTPPQFNLNVNKAEDFHGKKPADTPAPAPVVTSTHKSKSATQIEEGAKQEKAQTEKLNAAVAKLRAASEAKPIEIMQASDDVIIGIDPALDGADQTVVAEVAEDGTITPVEE